MKLPLKYIGILVVVSLATIFGYQIYWLFNMYHTEKEQTQTIIWNSIRNADHIEIFLRVDSVSKQENKTRHVVAETGVNDNETNITYSVSFRRDETADSTSLYYNQEITTDSSEIKRMERLKNATDEKAVKVGENYKSLEIMAWQAQQALHSAVDEAIGGVNLEYFDSVLNGDLRKANIDISHYSQVIYIPNDSVVKSGIPLEVNTSGMDIYEHIYDIHDHYAYRVFTTPIGPVILKRMVGILTSSFIILLLIGFSFWYLIRTLLRQRTLEEMKTDFTNNITHELKTPIAVAYAATDALLNFNKAEDKAIRGKYLLIAQEQLQRLSGLVEQILSMSMEQRKSLRLKPEEVEIKALIASLMEQHMLKAEKPVLFITDIQPDNMSVTIDRTHFCNILSNLVDNAVKYSSQSAVVTIHVRKNEMDQLILSVGDEGMGIPSDKLKYIFDRFYRVPSGNQHDVKGYGLGLYYVKNMVEKMGGTVSVKSEPGQGSIFTLVF